MSARVLVLLCTYNERHNLPAMISALWDTLPSADILVMDDNSPDGTGVWATEQAESIPKLNVVVRPGKLGLGSALRDGIRWCLQHQYDYLINLDADQSHDPRVCPTLLEPCLADPTGTLVTIGSRYVAGGASTGLSPCVRTEPRPELVTPQNYCVCRYGIAVVRIVVIQHRCWAS